MLLQYELQHRLPTIDTSTLVLDDSAEPAPSSLLAQVSSPGSRVSSKRGAGARGTMVRTPVQWASISPEVSELSRR